MPRFLAVVILIVATVTSAHTAFSQEGNPMTEEQISALSLVETMTAAFHSGDIDGVMATYEPRATVVFEPGEPITDPAVLREMFLGAFSVNPLFRYSGHEVFVAGDIAIHFAPWSMTGKAPDGTELTDSGLSVAVLRKQQDGRWLIVFDNPHGQRLLKN